MSKITGNRGKTTRDVAGCLRILSAMLIAGALLAVTGCAGGITAIRLPVVGYIDFDPPPVDRVDKAMMYEALVDAACQMRVGARTTWSNPVTGNSGTYTVTRVKTRRFSIAPEVNPLYSVYLPAVEIDEYIVANNGREYKTLGMNVYREHNGRWYRYR
mgnify:CR=1 FL=1